MSERMAVSRQKTVEAPHRAPNGGAPPVAEAPAATTAPSGAGHHIEEIPIEDPTTYVLSQPGDSLEREADRTAEQVVSAGGPIPPRPPSVSPASPVNTGAPVLARQETNASHESASDTTGVDDMLQSDGQPLDDSVRSLMEPRFGHHFGDVRVHTDSRAASSARALNASAYTVGNHIAFNNGQYAPDTDAGRYLIAHELTHVMQQEAAGSEPNQAARMVQRKAEIVQAPEWGGGGTSRVTFNPHAELALDGGKGDGRWFEGGHTDSFTVPRDSKGKVTIIADVFYYYDNATIGNAWTDKKSGMITAKTEASFKVTPEGKLEFTTMPAKNGNGGVPGLLDATWDSSAATSSDTEGAINLLTDLKATSSNASATGRTGTVQGGLQATPEGVGGSLGGNYQRTQTDTVTTSGSAHWTSTYAINLSVAPSGPVTLPEITIVSYQTVIYFKDPDQWIFEDNALGELGKWYVNMPPEGKDKVLSGQEKINVIGHTSTTGTHAHNFDLADKRTKEALKLLKQVAPSLKDDNFYVENQGEEAAATPDNVETKAERRVNVILSYSTGGPPTPSAASSSPPPKPNP